jgi:hypothetical protein
MFPKLEPTVLTKSENRTNPKETPSIKLKLGQQIGERLLIANHMGESL